MIEFAAGICLLAAAVCAALWWRARTGWRAAMVARDAAEADRAGMEALVETLPLALFRWPRDEAAEIALGSWPGGVHG